MGRRRHMIVTFGDRVFVCLPPEPALSLGLTRGYTRRGEAEGKATATRPDLSIRGERPRKYVTFRRYSRMTNIAECKVEGEQVRGGGVTTKHGNNVVTRDAFDYRYRAIYRSIKDAILNGSYQYAARIPSIRSLATELNVSRATVSKAYDLLSGEGYIAATGPSGTRVCYRRPPKVAPTRAVQNEAHGIPNYRPFQICVPAVDAFPRAIWLRISQNILRHRRRIEEVNTNAFGYGPLREAICSHIQVSRGVNCDPQQIFITTGYRQSLALLINALSSHGASILTEDPGYLPTYGLLRHFGLRPVPIPVDDNGLDILNESVQQAEAKMVIVTPAKQSALGICMSMERRLAMIDWAAENGAVIVEDDYDSEFCVDHRHAPTIFNLAGGVRTAFLGTFSKTIHPNLRIAYVVVPVCAVTRARAVASITMDGVPLFQQKVLADFIVNGHFAQHLSRSRRLYEQRRTVAIAVLTERLGDAFEFDRTSRGLQLLFVARHLVDDELVSKTALREGLAVTSLSSRYIEASPSYGLLLGFANFTSRSDLEKHSNILGRCVYAGG